MTSNQSFNLKTGGLEVAKAYSSQAAGKVALVTGVTVSGLGDAIVRSLAHGGASTIIITGRNEDRLAEVIKTLSSDYPKTRFRPAKFDYHSLKTVRATAQEILDDKSIPQLDIFIGNAGGSIFGPKVVTEDGLEQHFAGYVAHFLFVTLLLPKLRIASKKNAPGSTRIILMSSAAMVASPVRFSDWNWEDKPLAEDEKPDFSLFSLLGVEPTDKYEKNIAYAQCNTAKTLITVHLNKLLAQDNIYAFSVHPGTVRSQGANPIWNALTEEQTQLVENFEPFKTIDQGAATILVAALDPGLTPKAGNFLADCQFRDPPAYGADPAKSERLWKLTEDILGSKVAL